MLGNFPLFDIPKMWVYRSYIHNYYLIIWRFLPSSITTRVKALIFFILAPPSQCGSPDTLRPNEFVSPGVSCFFEPDYRVGYNMLWENLGLYSNSIGSMPRGLSTHNST